jgi:hypothetical protein
VILYAGDIHGKAKYVAEIDRKAVKEGVEYVIQVGDFGIQWDESCEISKYFEETRRNHKYPTWITCGGNHDNWEQWSHLSKGRRNSDLIELAPGCWFAQRGSVHMLEGIKHLFLGGAESIDKHHRVQGQDWWPEETPSYAEFSQFADALERDKPEVVVTHDAPMSVKIAKINRDKNPTPINLSNIIKLSTHKPSRWYFGHHHVVDRWVINGTTYYCCGFHGQYIRG